MSKAKPRDLQMQLIKTLLLDKEAPAPRVAAPFKKDRMNLSQDVLVARALREAPTEVHKRNPRTTYLSQLESLMTLMDEVAETQEAVKAKALEDAKKKAPAGKNAKGAWSNSKKTPIPSKGNSKKPLRKASLPKSRSLSSGAIVIK